MHERMDDAVVVIGAGIAGLACARGLVRAGRRVVVLERARGVGGRCATRRFDEQPVDFGVSFFHGKDARFLAALGEVPAQVIPGWPSEIRGAGRPCQPEAFAPGETRLAFAEGVSAFPKHLAAGLDVRTNARVVALGKSEAGIEVSLEGGEKLYARDVVLALANEQAALLLATWPEQDRAVRGALALLEMMPAEPCAVVIALYEAGAPRPPWHAYYPEESPVLQLVSHDSSKRESPSRLALVYQAHARFSRQNLDDPNWPRLVLDEAARLLGPWAGAPAVMHAHRWKYARTNLGAELSAPLVVSLGGGRIGLVGEVFSPGGGVAAAWCSGEALAERFARVEENR